MNPPARQVNYGIDHGLDVLVVLRDGDIALNEALEVSNEVESLSQSPSCQGLVFLSQARWHGQWC
jgi:hypothetical protein